MLQLAYAACAALHDINMKIHVVQDRVILVLGAPMGGHVEGKA